MGLVTRHCCACVARSRRLAACVWMLFNKQTAWRLCSTDTTPTYTHLPSTSPPPPALLQVVSDFLQSRLVGEGNVLRHLELLGYRLGYSQSTLMEYPFAITNLAVDLRDGLRLIKVAEVLTGTRGAQCAGQGAAPALLSQTTGTDTVPLCKKCASHNAVRARDCAVFTLSCR